MTWIPKEIPKLEAMVNVNNNVVPDKRYRVERTDNPRVVQVIVERDGKTFKRNVSVITHEEVKEIRAIRERLRLEATGERLAVK